MARSDSGNIPTGTIDGMLLDAARDHAGRLALVSEHGELGYAAFPAAVERLAERIAAVAAASDIESLRGARVAVIAPNAPAIVIALVACWRLGAVAVPLSSRLRERELSRMLDDAEPRVVVSLRSHLGYSFANLMTRLAPQLPSLAGHLILGETGEVEDVVPARADLRVGDALDPSVANLLYTSGSTGTPKGAICRHVREVEAASALADVLELEPDDTSIFVVPVSHAFGLTCLLATLTSGGTAVLVESTFSPEPVLTAITRRRATILHGSPTFFASIWKAAGGNLPPTLRGGFVAGALPPPQLFADLEPTGMRILNLYGLTEVGAVASCRLDDAFGLRSAAASLPLPGVELRVVERASVSGSYHEVQVRGPHVMPGYHRRPQDTEQAFDGDWFRTGDVGTIDNRRLRIVGRAKELVHVSGFNVSPAEVEAALLAHGDVAQACVVGIPDEKTGEALKAFVVLRRGAKISRAQLLGFMRERIAGYKLPYALAIVPNLPLLVSGKPDRLALERLAAAERSGQKTAGAKIPLE